MEFVERDFDGLLLNVYKYPLGTDLFKVFPILTKYEEFAAGVGKGSMVSKEKVIRYIIYAFDRNSPITAINDILERRVEAAKLAGFDFNEEGRFITTVDKIVRSLNVNVNNMVIRYCMLLGDIDYSVMVTYEDSLFKELERLVNFDTKKTVKSDDTGVNEKKKELISNISTLRASINELRASFLANNVDYYLSRSLSEFSESKKIDLSPEFYAKKLKGWDNISRYYNEVNVPTYASKGKQKIHNKENAHERPIKKEVKNEKAN